MTLKEKFIKLTKKFSPNLGWVDDVEDAEKCEKLAEDFAIEFAEWMAIYCPNHKNLLLKQRNFRGFLTTKELLEIYKKEKGL